LPAASVVVAPNAVVVSSATVMVIPGEANLVAEFEPMGKPAQVVVS
jgi:hypothetical protein